MDLLDGVSTASEGGSIGGRVGGHNLHKSLDLSRPRLMHASLGSYHEANIYHLKGPLYQLFRDTTRHCAEGLNWRNAKEPKDIIQSARVLKAFNQGHKSGISVEASSQ